ncbi:MAG: TrkH family potassium uptake protein [Geminicoccaceae bacterium]|nr:TrkH family potassium uptake protein [Geminicoccaceae bacterium]
MLVPLAVDYAADNPDWQGFLGAAAFTGFAGVLLILSTRRSREAIPLKGAFVLTTLSWLAIAVFGSVPMQLGIFRLSFTDAVFETVSGLTTTGSTVVTGLDQAPPGFLLWRSLLQWLGGIGIIVMALVMLPFLRVGGMQLFRTESSDRTEKLLPTMAAIVRQIVYIYAGLTVLCAAAYYLAGMDAFDAVNHAMTTLATGGYSTHDASMGYFKSPAIHWIGTLFMASAALPFTRYVAVVNGRPGLFFGDEQIRLFVAFCLAVAGILTLWLVAAKGWPALDALRSCLFNVVSVVTTTGFASEDYSVWGAPAVAMFLAITVVGGCTGSTAGGIKMFRLEILWRWAASYLRSLFLPHAINRAHYGGKPLDQDTMLAVLSFAFVFIGSWGAFSVVLGGLGLDLITAVSSAATALANVGPGLGEIVGPAGNFQTLSDPTKWVLILAMLLGRLEFFTVLVLLHPGFWRR